MQIKVKIDRKNDSYEMSFVAKVENREDEYPLPPKALIDFNLMKTEFEGRLMEPGVKEAVGKRIEELSDKWFGEGSKYVLVPGIGFMNRGSLGHTP